MEGQPLIRVERGTPTPEELAALVGVLLSRPATGGAEPRAGSRWAASGRPGAGARRGPDAWRAAALPR